jgi:hypothetical protein
MSEQKEARSEVARNEIAGLILMSVIVLAGVASYGTHKFTTGLEKLEVEAAIQAKLKDYLERERILRLEIRSLEDQIDYRDRHITVLEGEFVFGGSISGTYTEKEARLQQEYLKRRENIVRARTLPILTAQIDELRPHYKNSHWAKKKIPNLPDSRILAEYFYDAGKEVDINPMILIAVAWTESRFRPDVSHGLKVSSAGAVGMMQIMPFHVARFEFIDDLKHLTNNIRVNIRTGAYILREYLDHKYATEADNRLLAALRLYNYGPTNYKHRVRKKRKFNDYAETVIEKADNLFDQADPFRGKIDPENDPAKHLLYPLAMKELPENTEAEAY